MTKSQNISHSIYILIGVFCYIVFFIPQEYAVGAQVYRLFQGAMLVVSSAVLLLYIAFGSITKRWVMFCLFYLSFYILSTLFSNSDGNITSCIFSAIKGIGFITLTELYIQYDKRAALLSFCLAAGIMCAVHLASVFQYMDVIGGMRHGYIPSDLGMTRATDQNWYFLTYDNESIMYFLPFVCMCVIYGMEYNRTALGFGIVFAVLITYTYIAKQAATAMVSILLFEIIALLILITKNSARSIVVGYRLACFLGIIGSIIVIAGIGSGIFSDIASTLGKDPTFSGRSMIWQNSIHYIAKLPIFGNGIENSATTYIKIGQTHCHNIILQILYSGGVIALATFMGGLAFSAPHSKETNISISIISAAILSFFLSAAIDWYPTIPIPFILFYATSFSSNNDSKKVFV